MSRACRQHAAARPSANYAGSREEQSSLRRGPPSAPSPDPTSTQRTPPDDEVYVFCGQDLGAVWAHPPPLHRHCLGTPRVELFQGHKHLQQVGRGETEAVKAASVGRPAQRCTPSC